MLAKIGDECGKGRGTVSVEISEDPSLSVSVRSVT